MDKPRRIWGEADREDGFLDNLMFWGAELYFRESGQKAPPLILLPGICPPSALSVKAKFSSGRQKGTATATAMAHYLTLWPVLGCLDFALLVCRSHGCMSLC